MAKILLNNSDDFSNEKKKDEINSSIDSKQESIKEENILVSVSIDDFAIFPNWDVLPPDSIINPRIKRKL